MSTSGVSGAAASVGISVQVTRKAQEQMVKDGKAAISLIRANEALAGRHDGQAQSGAKLDVKA
ncbi:MAG TPA: hypothetical protein PKE00_04910 [Planctomycetota bacterium]|nr:hypothetical protein [Planctomycetota bacterium]